jgi:hypothetical protein
MAAPSAASLERPLHHARSPSGECAHPGAPAAPHRSKHHGVILCCVTTSLGLCLALKPTPLLLAAHSRPGSPAPGGLPNRRCGQPRITGWPDPAKNLRAARPAR